MWRSRVDGRTNEAGMLSADEQARAARFRFDDDRTRWVAARIFLRTVLARYLAADPTQLTFEGSARERPRLSGPSQSGWLHFSLTHSGDLSLVAVARDRDVGVDVEVVRPNRDLRAIARRVLGNATAEALDALSAQDRVGGFYRAWVRHEARGKCLGRGLVEPDDHQDKPSPPVVDLELEAPYVGAVAVRDRVGRFRHWTTELQDVP